jgi:enolase
MNTYNVIGDLKKLVGKFPDIAIEDKFSSNDWNVVVPDEDVDEFIQFCEDNNFKTKLV